MQLNTGISGFSQPSWASRYFCDCKSLETFGPCDLSKLVNIDCMFEGCSTLKSVNLTISPDIKTIHQLFKNCSSLENVKCNFNNVSTLYSTFENCKSLKSINLDFSNLKYDNGIFSGCTSLTSVNLINFKPKSLSYTFSSCPIDFPTIENIDLSELTMGTGAFSGTKLSNFKKDMPLLESAGQMFISTPLQYFESNTSALKSAGFMLYNCPSLKSVKMDFTSLEDGTYMFGYCPLDSESAFDIITQLKTKNVAEGNSKYLTLGNIPRILSQNADFLSLCGVNSIADGQTISIYNPKGTEWRVTIWFHNIDY